MNFIHKIRTIVVLRLLLFCTPTYKHEEAHRHDGGRNRGSEK